MNSKLMIHLLLATSVLTTTYAMDKKDEGKVELDDKKVTVVNVTPLDEGKVELDDKKVVLLDSSKKDEIIDIQDKKVIIDDKKKVDFVELFEKAEGNPENILFKEKSDISSLEVLDTVLNKKPEAKARVLINGKVFKMVDVLGGGMDCFFNAAGLIREDMADLLTKNLDDPEVLLMIANEIIATVQHPTRDLFQSVADAIGYDEYVKGMREVRKIEQERQEVIEEKREAEELVQQFKELKAEIPHEFIEAVEILSKKLDTYPNGLKLKAMDDEVVKKLWFRSLNPKACQAFINAHIRKSGMMMELLPKVREDHSLSSMFAIDAMAKVLKMGLKIYTILEHGGDVKANETDQRDPLGKTMLKVGTKRPYYYVRPTHSYIPEGAETIHYLLLRETGLHFYSLIEDKEKQTKHPKETWNMSNDGGKTYNVLATVFFPHDSDDILVKKLPLVTTSSKVEEEKVVKDDTPIEQKDEAVDKKIEPKKTSDVLPDFEKISNLQLKASELLKRKKSDDEVGIRNVIFDTFDVEYLKDLIVQLQSLPEKEESLESLQEKALNLVEKKQLQDPERAKKHIAELLDVEKLKIFIERLEKKEDKK